MLSDLLEITIIQNFRYFVVQENYNYGITQLADCHGI